MERSWCSEPKRPHAKADSSRLNSSLNFSELQFLSLSSFLNGDHYTCLVEPIHSTYSIDFFSFIVVAAATAAVEIGKEEG